MKRQKRDRLERAHAQGYRAGVTGRSKELCPYQSLDARSAVVGGVSRCDGRPRWWSV